jgi:6,7-dimethyl-8-ribityllumazine synthase
MATKGNTRLKKLSTGAHEFQGACVVIVKTEWNAEIVDELEKGCRKILAKEGVKMVSTITVPGAIEIPFAIKSYWDKVKYRDDRPQAFVSLGCVIKGDTPHFDYVCQSVTAGVTHLNLHLPIPVIFGIITVNNQQQAEERIGGKHGHKGEEAAITALKMISLIKTFK